MTPKKLSAKALKSFNARHNNEYSAHYFYSYVAQCLMSRGFEIAAKFFYKEAEDELNHAKMIAEYVNKWNGEIEFTPVKEPKEVEGVDNIVGASYEMEYALLNAYKSDSMEFFESGELEHFIFLQQFVSIQTDAVGEYSDKLNMIALFDKTDPSWMFQFEKKLFKA